MRALVTCAHTNLFQRLRRFSDPIVCDIFRQRNLRRLQYRESIESLLRCQHLFQSITLIECLSNSVPSYLKKYKKCQTAVSSNSIKCSNKGVQEFVNIANYLKMANVDGDDMIIKLTGRYLLLDDRFPKLCSTSKADVIAKKDHDIWGDKGKGVHTFLFGARAKVFIKFKEWLFFEGGMKEIGRNPIEWGFKTFVENYTLQVTLVEEPIGIVVRYAQFSDGDTTVV